MALVQKNGLCFQEPLCELYYEELSCLVINENSLVFKMDYNIEEESLKVIRLRDKVLLEKEDYDDANFVRLKIEKKLRDQFNKTKNYNKYLKNGRIDLIDPQYRSNLITPIKDLQEAYYENYKSRKDREDEELENNKHQQIIKPTSEAFYDGDYTPSSIPSSDPQELRPTSSGLKPPQVQNLSMNQQQFRSATQSPIPQQMLPHSSSPLITTSQPFSQVFLQQQHQQQNQTPPPFIPMPNFPMPPFFGAFPQQNQPWPFPQQNQQVPQQFQQQQPFQPQPGASAFQFMSQMSQMNQINPAAQHAYFQNLQLQLQAQQGQQGQQQAQFHPPPPPQQQQSQGINYGDGEILPTPRQTTGPNKPLQPY